MNAVLRAVLLRLMAAVPVLFGVVLLTFVLTRVLPGDPALFFASNPTMTEADIAEVRARLGLDAPLPVQFLTYLSGLMRGDLGQSLTTGQSVRDELAARLPASAELTLAAFALTLVTALPLGVLAALRPGSLADHLARIVSSLGVALPTFVTGLLLIFVFYVRLDIAPEPIGRLDPFLFDPPRRTGFFTLDALLAGEAGVFASALGQLALPALTMALFATAPLLRMTRASMLAVLGTDYIRAARAAGLSSRRILLSYALRNALVPVVTLAGMTFSYMLGANVLVERVFSWPGIGAFAVESIVSLDYAPLQGFMLVMAGLFLMVNLATDILVLLIDPRAGE